MVTPEVKVNGIWFQLDNVRVHFESIGVPVFLHVYLSPIGCPQWETYKHDKQDTLWGELESNIILLLRVITQSDLITDMKHMLM